MKKKIITAILAACMLAGATTPATFAAEHDDVGLYWVNTSDITTTLTFVGNTGHYGLDVIGKTGTSRIVVEPTLYKYQSGRWVEVDTDWNSTYSSNSKALYLGLVFDAVSGTKYKVETNIIVTKNGANESITDTITETC